MPKEKIQIDENIKKNREFYYESIGLLSILLVFVIFVEIGKVGLILKIIFKFLFGDWYFLVLGYMLFMGIFYLVKHKVITFKNLRLNGFFLLIFSLMLLNQQSISGYTKINGLNGFAGVWELYLNYIKYYDNSFVMGGGLIGALGYTFLAFLLGEIGIIILSMFLLLISLIFLTNNTVFSFFKKININLKYIDKIPNFFQRYIQKIDLSKVKVTKEKQKNNIRISINHLTDVKDNMNVKLQEQYSKDLQKMILNILELQNTEHKLLKFEMGISITRFQIKIIYNFNLELFKNKIVEIMEINPYININNDVLIIEVKNKFKSLFTLRKCMELDTESVSGILPIGIKINNNLCYFDLNFDKHLYVIGDLKSGIKTFFRSIFVENLIKKRTNTYFILDFKRYFEEFKLINNKYINYTNSISALENYLEMLNVIIEERIEIFNYYKINSYVDFEKVKIDSEFKKPERIFVFISAIEEIYRDANFNSFENKIFYILTVGEKYGINFVFYEYEKLSLESKLKNYITKNVIFKVSNLERISKVSNTEYCMFLLKNGDAIYKDDLLFERIQTPFISKLEFQEILNKLK